MTEADLLPLDDGWYDLVSTSKNGFVFDPQSGWNDTYRVLWLYVSHGKIVHASGSDGCGPPTSNTASSFVNGWRRSLTTPLEDLLLETHPNRIKSPDVDEWADEFEVEL